MRTKEKNYRELASPLVLAVCMAALLFLAGCEEEKVEAPPPAPPEVVLTEVTKENVPIVLQASGTIKAFKRVEIVPRVTGFIFERFFTGRDANPGIGKPFCRHVPS